MKKMKWLSVLLVVALVVIMAAPAAYAAQPSETVTATFSFSGIYGIDGTFTFSNPDLLSNISYSTSGMAGSAANNKVYLYSAEESNVSIVITAKVSASAADGDSCTITFNYQTSDENGNMTAGSTSRTITVSIPVNPTDPTSPTNPTNPTNPTSPTKPTESEEETKADTTELERQIKIAEGLTEGEYTAESWKAVADALANARALLDSNDQKKVDKAASDLAAAIANLVKMDYTRLQAAIDSAKELTDTDEIGQKFTALISALSDGIGKLTSTDQAEVDAAAEELEALIADLKEALNQLREPEIVEVEKTVEVEVEPKDPYCNISLHKVWPVLFFISLALNVVLIVLIVVFVNRKKRAQKDSTPLVDYDIGDDEP